MAADDMRTRYLSNRVLTASPAQRVVMLYDRLGLDITRAQAAHDSDDPITASGHTSHAAKIVAELRSSLNTTAWAGAEDLAALYSYLLLKLLESGRPAGADLLPHLGVIVTELRASWHRAAEEVSDFTNGATAATGRLAADQVA